MARFLLILCLAVAMLAQPANAAFVYDSAIVKIYPDKYGNAHVIERIELQIDDEASARLYDENIAITNDITSWRTRTGISEVRYHINPNVAPITNLRVIPQPKTRVNIINPTYNAVLQIEYDATGVFNRTQVKARTYECRLKKDALYFSFNAKNDIVLEETDHLYIILPEDVVAVSVDPLAQNVDVLEEDSREFFWRGKTILQDFSFVYRHEESMRDEVESYFSRTREMAYAFASSAEGTYLALMVLVMAVSFLLLKHRTRAK
ncbi:MAG: hypothetical protein N3H30_01520 [Candidatus Micrarchaeota archaeon]|nr:hypothetical protein [Candidatus Micrarchaeota archaeon]